MPPLDSKPDSRRLLGRKLARSLGRLWGLIMRASSTGLSSGARSRASNDLRDGSAVGVLAELLTDLVDGVAAERKPRKAYREPRAGDGYTLPVEGKRGRTGGPHHDGAESGNR